MTVNAAPFLITRSGYRTLYSLPKELQNHRLFHHQGRLLVLALVKENREENFLAVGQMEVRQIESFALAWTFFLMGSRAILGRAKVCFRKAFRPRLERNSRT